MDLNFQMQCRRIRDKFNLYRQLRIYVVDLESLAPMMFPDEIEFVAKLIGEEDYGQLRLFRENIATAIVMRRNNPNKHSIFYKEPVVVEETPKPKKRIRKKK